MENPEKKTTTVKGKNGTPDGSRYLKMFAPLHLDDDAKNTLCAYLRFLTDNCSRTIPFNFMVAVDDDSRLRTFVDILAAATEKICGGTCSAEYKTESGIQTEFDRRVFPARISPEPESGDGEHGDSENGGGEAASAKTTQSGTKRGIITVNCCLPDEEYPCDREVWEWFFEKYPDRCIILAGPADVLKERLRDNEQLYFRIFRNHLAIGNMTADEVLKSAVKQLEADFPPVSAEYKRALKSYIDTVYPNADLLNEAFVNDLVERIFLEYYKKPQKDRVLSPELHIPHYRRVMSVDEAMQKLDNLVVPEEVKTVFRELPFLMADKNEKDLPTLHMAFVGNPGTGKTMVAELAADLFYAMGIIKKNKVVTVNALELLGKYIGDDSALIRGRCKQAYGGILFIDEAYLLADNRNESTLSEVKRGVVGTLIQEMENNRDRLLVIFAGYEKEMDDFLYKTNSGLGSRIYKTVKFSDFSDDELMRIFRRRCTEENYRLTVAASEALRQRLSVERYSRNFGNARTVRQIFNEVKASVRKRKPKGAHAKTIEACDIALPHSLRDFETVSREFYALTGLESAKNEIKRAIEWHRYLNETGKNCTVSRHMLFLGNAGTGKSTVARLYCEMLYAVGAAKSPNAVMISASDILGQSNPVASLREYCTRADGGVLFIDEAYIIQEYPVFCASFVSVLLETMEEKRDRIIVILGGYENEMIRFLDRNQGLKSRFGPCVYFEDYSVDELCTICRSMFKANGFSIDAGAMREFRRLISAEKRRDGFGNARTVRNIVDQTMITHAQNIASCGDEKKRDRIFKEDITEPAILDKDYRKTFMQASERPRVRFDDIIGAENAKEELRDFLAYMNNPKQYLKNGGVVTKGILLYGPQGTGKTMLAKATAGEADCRFIQLNAADLSGFNPGEAEKKIREVFRQARIYAPSVLFIDDIDIIGKARTAEESELTQRMRNILLAEMNDLSDETDVYVIAATGFGICASSEDSRVLDETLVERFDRRIFVGFPNGKDRREFLLRNTGGFSDLGNIIGTLVRRTQGTSLSVLEHVVRLAKKTASRANRTPTGEDLREAFEKYNFGDKRIISGARRKETAIHEAGHAYVAYLSGHTPVYASVESRGPFLGYVSHENNSYRTKEEFLWRIRCALAGRGAELVFFREEKAVNIGASSDLRTATRYALCMICENGMEDETLIALPVEVILSSPAADRYIEKANAIITEQMKIVLDMIRDGKESVKRLADELCKKERLFSDDIVEILSEPETARENRETPAAEADGKKQK